jgi:uncharacterized protein YhaN
MKITDLQMEHYGIYQNDSFQPVQNELNVIMGENESGKTTLLRFIRDMIFGFKRGQWRGRKGNMAFTRSNGDSYRVFHDGKDSYFVDSHNEKYTENMPALWWHGLTRSMYEHIFAVGLEDLQGVSLLSDDQVRSRFFMLEGGDHLADARKTVSEKMEELLAASRQGKRKINELVTRLSEIDEELKQLSSQETDFASLQKEQKDIRQKLDEVNERLAKNKEEYDDLGKRLGAWEYYKKAREIRRGLKLGSEVRLFPANGKEQWNKLMGRMKAIHDQKDALQAKLDAYTPHTREEVIPWAGVETELDNLYVNLGQWRQLIADGEDLKAQKEAWRKDYANLGYELPLWDHPLNPDEECYTVNWDDGRLLAKSVSVRTNEIHFWKQREPEVEDMPEVQSATGKIHTEKEWNELEANAGRMEEIVHARAGLQKQIEDLSHVKDRRYTVWFWLGLLCLLGGVGAIGAFAAAMAGTAALYAAGVLIVLGIIGLFVNSHITRKKGKKMGELKTALAALEKEKANIAEEIPVETPENEEDLQAFHNLMQNMRSEFYRMQANMQAMSWKKETVRRQEEEHKKWESEGKLLREAGVEAVKQWNEWLSRYHLPDVPADKLSQLQEQWQKMYAARGKGKIINVLIEKNHRQQEEFQHKAEVILKAAGLTTMEPVPDSIASIYEENRSRALEWQAISEKNRQHEADQMEMKKLEASWASCEQEMKTLMDFVNAKTPTEFAERVTAHEHQGQLLKDWENIRRDLRFYAGSDEEFQKLWKSLETGQYDEWMDSYQKLGKTLEEDRKFRDELQHRAGAVENEINRLAGDNSITDVLQEREKLAWDLEVASKEWMTAAFTDGLMEAAQKKYETGRRPAILKKANEFLEAMTGGKYTLLFSADGTDVELVDKAHNRKESRLWSSGTGDQVYLAIRLAMAIAFGRQIEPLPIVLDDIFVRFDENRQKETLRFLFDLGKEQQIFLFTCHEQTLRMAMEVGKEKQAGAFIKLEHGTVHKLN